MKKESTVYGLALIVGSLGGLTTLFFHPTGQDLLGQPEDLMRRSEVITVVTHTIAIFASLLLFFGLYGLSRIVKDKHTYVAAALVSYGLAVVAAVLAVVINGLVGPSITRKIVTASDAGTRQIWIAIFENNTLLNQSFDRIFVVAAFVTIILFSLVLLRRTPFLTVLAGWGILTGLVGIVGVMSGYIRMDIHSFGLLVFGQLVWNIGAGIALLWPGHLASIDTSDPVSVTY
jgi:hypothetical protein